MTSYSYCNISDAFDGPLHDEINVYQNKNDAINDPFYNDFTYNDMNIDNTFISATGEQHIPNLHQKNNHLTTNVNVGTSINELRQQQINKTNYEQEQKQQIIKPSVQKISKPPTQKITSTNTNNFNNSNDILKLIMKMQDQINKQSQIISNLSNIQLSNQINQQPNQINSQNGIFNLDPKTKDLLLIFLIGFLLIFVVMMIFKK